VCVSTGIEDSNDRGDLLQHSDVLRIYAETGGYAKRNYAEMGG